VPNASRRPRDPWWGDVAWSLTGIAALLIAVLGAAGWVRMPEYLVIGACVVTFVCVQRFVIRGNLLWMERPKK
jgi:hypothetical protein